MTSQLASVTQPAVPVWTRTEIAFLERRRHDGGVEVNRERAAGGSERR